jgi:hypothetical protein
MKPATSILALFFLAVGCSEDPSSTPAPAPVGDGGAGDASNAGGACTAARDQLLKPIDAVSTGGVRLLSEQGGVRTLYVDASAGGVQGGSTNPRLYLALGTGTKVEVTDNSAPSSTAWDLALKRPVLFTNSGDGGAGVGGAVRIDKEFSLVTASDGAGKAFSPESFLENETCAAKVDATGAVKTSFDGWYAYEQATNILTPAAATWIVKGAAGAALYKVRIVSYYATDDGGVGQAGGRYVLEVAAL